MCIVHHCWGAPNSLLWCAFSRVAAGRVASGFLTWIPVFCGQAGTVGEEECWYRVGSFFFSRLQYNITIFLLVFRDLTNFTMVRCIALPPLLVNACCCLMGRLELVNYYDLTEFLKACSGNVGAITFRPVSEVAGVLKWKLESLCEMICSHDYIKTNSGFLFIFKWSFLLKIVIFKGVLIINMMYFSRWWIYESPESLKLAA